jgi:hypothetical protein
MYKMTNALYLTLNMFSEESKEYLLIIAVLLRLYVKLCSNYCRIGFHSAKMSPKFCTATVQAACHSLDCL